MSTASRLALFALLLGGLFGAALALGAAVDPDSNNPNASHEENEMSETHAGEQHGGASSQHSPAGLAVAQEGLRLVPSQTRFQAGAGSQPLSFRILDQEGEPVREFETEHARRMHLILVRRDLAEFEHVHPRMDEDGTWSVGVRFPSGGVYRAYADFSTGGKSVTLATDLHADGEYRSVPLPEPAQLDRVDGYEVRLRREGQDLEFEVLRDGQRVSDLQEYLGADGHLVALREGDLAFLHTHPEHRAEPGTIRFMAEYPSAGSYRLFLQFKHEGRVHTARFTQAQP